jgi:hypothetical protein
VITVAEVDVDVVDAIAVNNHEIFMAGFGVDATIPAMAKLNS